MSFSVPIVQIGKIGRHPNADNLSLTQITGETVIFKTGDFKEGDLAIYVPEDAVVPTTVPGTEFLGTHRRIRAKRLRGLFSCGLLLPVSILPEDPEGMDALNPDEWVTLVGFDVSQRLGITKYEAPVSLQFGGENERDPGYMPKYEIESHRKFGHVYIPGERVIITEKIHGTNFRAVYRDDRLWVGSHTCIKKESDTNIYWKAAKNYDLAGALQPFPCIAIYGEVHGQVQKGYGYGIPKGEIDLRIFDMYDTVARRWLDWEEVVSLAKQMEINTVPVVYDGPYVPSEIPAMAEGKSTLADHNREGVVIKTANYRWSMELGRVITKYVSEDFRLKKSDDAVSH